MVRHDCIGLASLALAFALFLVGYFPVKPGNPSLTRPSPPASWTQRKVGQLVIVVIDALRADFVFEGVGNAAHSDRLAKLELPRPHLGVVLRTSPPTVTLPRIRAILSGSVPAYMDVINNINSGTIEEDTLLLQWQQAGLKTVLFGDETWARVSPVPFLRSDPTSSFFVKDYTEVDLNVTRHLKEELAKNDWDIMILHYLGLDHIGHIEGPYSPLVQPKLNEMAENLEYITDALFNKADKNNLPPVVAVLGDHGMAEAGGHGGASEQELLVPLVVMSPEVHVSSNKKLSERLQLDLTPTLSFLTGVHIPKCSIGRLLGEIVKPLTSGSYISAIQYNAEQLSTLADTSSPGLALLEEATNRIGSKDSDGLESLFESALDLLQSALVSKGAEYDLYLLATSVFLIFCSAGTEIASKNILQILLLACCILGAHFLVCSYVESILCSLNPISIFVFVFVVSILPASLKNVLKIFKLPKENTRSHDAIAVIFIILHSLSLLSSSFVEEEHQTYYFLLTTMLCIGGLASSDLNTYMLYLLALGLHRLLRSFHQTGDKWRHLPDLADYLHDKDAKIYLFIAAMLCTVLLANCTKQNAPTNATIAVLIIIQKQSDSTGLAKCIYLLLLLKFLLNRSKQSLFESLLYLCCLLHDETDAVIILLLVVLLNLTGSLIACNTTSCSPLIHTVIICLLAKSSFFYLGNSNSLATINVGAGYTGLTDYNPTAVQILLACHTFTGPILTFAFFLQDHYQSPPLLQLPAGQPLLAGHLLRGYLLTTWADITVFSLLCVQLRYHIFVWTVFSPKLCYFGMELVVFNAFFWTFEGFQKLGLFTNKTSQ